MAWKFYAVYIPLAILATIMLIKYMNKKSDEKKYKILIILSILAFISHIIKPFFFPYTNYQFPNILRKITFENVCAVSALVYPFILLSKKKVLLDYMLIIGLLGGLLAFLYPTEVILGQFDSMIVTYKHGLFAFDTIRFFFVHYILFIIPFLLIHYNIHKLKMKRAFYLPILIMGMLMLVYINELVLETLGWLDDVHLYAQNNLGINNIFNDVNIRNSSFVFGIPDNYGNAGLFLTILVPKSFKYPHYLPVFWITIPVIIYGPLLYLAFYKLTNKSIKKNKLIVENS